MGTQPVDKPTGAFVLALIGGIIGIIAGIILIIAGLFFTSILGYSGYYGYDAILMIYAGLGIWGMIASAIVIASAVKLHSNPEDHTRWGVMILIFSIVGLVGLLGVIGGIWALVWKPHTAAQPWAGPAPQATQPISRICPKCGRVIEENVKFCPHCGQELA